MLMMGDRSWAQGCLPPHLVTDTSWKLILPDSRWGGVGE